MTTKLDQESEEDLVEIISRRMEEGVEEAGVTWEEWPSGEHVMAAPTAGRVRAGARRPPSISRSASTKEDGKEESSDNKENEETEANDEEAFDSLLATMESGSERGSVEGENTEDVDDAFDSLLKESVEEIEEVEEDNPRKRSVDDDFNLLLEDNDINEEQLKDKVEIVSTPETSGDEEEVIIASVKNVTSEEKREVANNEEGDKTEVARIPNEDKAPIEDATKVATEEAAKDPFDELFEELVENGSDENVEEGFLEIFGKGDEDVAVMPKTRDMEQHGIEVAKDHAIETRKEEEKKEKQKEKKEEEEAENGNTAVTNVEEVSGKGELSTQLARMQEEHASGGEGISQDEVEEQKVVEFEEMTKVVQKGHESGANEKKVEEMEESQVKDEKVEKKQESEKVAVKVEAVPEDKVGTVLSVENIKCDSTKSEKKVIEIEEVIDEARVRELAAGLARELVEGERVKHKEEVVALAREVVAEREVFTDRIDRLEAEAVGLREEGGRREGEGERLVKANVNIKREMPISKASRVYSGRAGRSHQVRLLQGRRLEAPGRCWSPLKTSRIGMRFFERWSL